MSFILDAIAKSEQERQQQEVPGVRVLALPAGGVRQPLRIMPYFIIGALLLNAALFVIWMQSGQTLLDSFSPTQIGNIDRGNEQGIASDNTTPADPTVSAEITANVTTPEVFAEIDTRASINEPLAEQQSATTASISEAVTGLVSGHEKASATTTVGDITARNLIEPEASSNKAHSGQSAEPVQDLQDNTVMPRKVSSLSELPSTVRKDLPTIVFTGHLYSSNPDLSYVLVDEGRAVRKKQQIVNELLLHEITPTGVIVEFRGYLIEVGVMENWTLN
jgi:general secretion pathway protein B